MENTIFSFSEEGRLSSTASAPPFLCLQALATMDRIYVLHPKPLAAGRLEGAKWRLKPPRSLHRYFTREICVAKLGTKTTYPRRKHVLYPNSTR